MQCDECEKDAIVGWCKHHDEKYEASNTSIYDRYVKLRMENERLKCEIEKLTPCPIT